MDGSEDHERETKRQKDVAFYSAVVNAWVTTRMEKDRTLIVLSAGGIGVLVSLLTATGPHDGCCLALYLVATLAFLAAIILALCVLSRNATYLERVVRGDDRRDHVLRSLDHLVMASFLLGVVLAITAGALSGQTESGMGGDDYYERRDHEAVPNTDTGDRQQGTTRNQEELGGHHESPADDSR